MTDSDSPAASTAPGGRPGVIDAVPVRHPGRWVAIVLIAALVGELVKLLATNDAFDWSFVGKAMVQSPVLHGLVVGTLVGTAGSMAIGVVLGVIVAVMRLSENPILRWTAFAYTCFFRAVPRLVLLTIMGQLGILFPGPHGLRIAVPFDREIQHLLGMDGTWTFFSLDANQVFVGVLGGVIGLGLSEAAYMAEIARAGILSVDPGQGEAAAALGMSRSMAMRRVVLPQAMRVIVPPTGNETIAMVKDTSLLIGIPVISELFYQLKAIGSRTYETFPVLVASVIWYLIICSVLMVIQSQLERYFGRGFGGKAPSGKARETRAKPLGMTPGAGGGR